MQSHNKLVFKRTMKSKSEFCVKTEERFFTYASNVNSSFQASDMIQKHGFRRLETPIWHLSRVRFFYSFLKHESSIPVWDTWNK